jgi:integrase
MSSLHRKFRSPFWFCRYRDACGLWRSRSTKLTDREEAKKFCLGLQTAQNALGKENPAAEQLRRIVDDTMRSITGEGLAAATVRGWLTEWLALKEGTAADQTLERYRQAAKHFLAFLGQQADDPLEAITQKDIIAFRNHLRGQGKAVPTINLMLSIVAIPFRQAAAQGVITRSPLAAIPRLIERGVRRRQPFTVEDVRKLLTAAEGDWVGAILAGYSTGARLTDLANLRWSDVDLENGVIAFVQAKTQREAVVGLHPDFEQWLREQKITGGPIFPSLARRRTGGSHGLSAQFREIMQRAGIESETIRTKQGQGQTVRSHSFHSFRHGAASHVFTGKVVEESVKRVTGHGRGQAHRHYLHVDLTAVRAATSMIPRI